MSNRSIVPALALGGILFGLASCGGSHAATAAAPSGDPSSTPGSSPAIATATLPGAQVGQPYSATLAATGGQTPYIWSVSGGQLPQGIALAAASGTLSGMPQTSGKFSFTVQVTDALSHSAETTLQLTVAAGATTGGAPAGLDAYGGVQAVTTAGGGSGFFRVSKIGARWVFVDPDGHPLWIKGVFDMDDPDPRGCPGGCNPLSGKYGGDNEAWAVEQAHRIVSWGFNSAAEYSYVYPARETSLPLPYMNLDRFSYYGMLPSAYAPQPFKNLINGFDGEYQNYTGDLMPDVWDPDFATYVTHETAANDEAHKDDPYFLGTAVGDADDLWGYSEGPAINCGHNATNLGWAALCVNPNFATGSIDGKTVAYSDTTVYSKAHLIAWLEAKYQNSIAALNAAWKSSYCGFIDSGGWGAGCGLADEDGRNPWVGNDDALLSQATPGVKADLNAFALLTAQQFASVTAGALRGADPNHLVWGPATVNGFGCVAPREILQAFGQYFDVIQASIGSQQQYDLTLSYAGDKPLVGWLGVGANADSELAKTANGTAGLATQADRGSWYAQQMTLDWAIAGSSAAGALQGSYNMAGNKWWALYDSYGEDYNWGLLDFMDNAYDGREDRTAICTDQWGYSCGGEPTNMGDALSAMIQANLLIDSELATALSAASASTAAEPRRMARASAGSATDAARNVPDAAKARRR